MITVAVCGGIALVVLAGLAAGLWRDFIKQSRLEDQAGWDAHVAAALDLAFDPDHDDFRQWQEQLLWPEYQPRFRPWIEPDGLTG